MMKGKRIVFLLCTFLLLGFSLININPFDYPDHFPKPYHKLVYNDSIQSKIDLGRSLFYDPILSRNNTISCASCHSPYNAFAHSDHDLSHGIDDEIGTRNAPALFNLAWQKLFMWDGAINHIDMQALAPISHPKEMDETIENVIKKLQETSVYPVMYYKAFGDSIITGAHTLKALSQFQLTLISANSKYDKVKQNEVTFSEQEEKGYTLFKKHCNSCHTEPLFSNYGFANNGLAIDTTLNDYGRIKITQLKKDSLLFKIPSLRNLSFSSPYMHDGRFGKLSEVINHYTTNLHQSETLTKELQNPIALSANEKIDLIAFLLTLDDKTFVFDPSNKFPRKN